jgi:hypothetical protein
MLLQTNNKSHRLYIFLQMGVTYFALVVKYFALVSVTHPKMS